MILCATGLVPTPILGLALDLVQGVTRPILQPRKRQRTVKSPFQTMSLATKLKAGSHLTSMAICHFFFKVSIHSGASWFLHRIAFVVSE